MPFSLYFPTPVLMVTPEEDVDNELENIQKEVEQSVVKIKEDDDYESLSDASFDESKGTVFKRKSSLGIEFTSFANHVIAKYDMKSLTLYIQKYVQKYINTTEWSFLTDPRRSGQPYKIAMSDSWMNITRRENFHHSHIHAHHSLSGVFYHKISKEMGGITFRNPNQMISNMMFPEGPMSPNMITIVPDEGTLLLFPSWLQHHTQKNDTDEERITISFNIDVF